MKAPSSNKGRGRIFPWYHLSRAKRLTRMAVSQRCGWLSPACSWTAFHPAPWQLTAAAASL